MRHYSDKALRSFFGARTGGQDRPQNINTPQFLVDAILELWPKGIELDPCSNAWSKVPARNKVVAKEIGGNIYFVSSQKYPVDKNGGLSIDWPDYTYANIPYRDIKEWLIKPVPTMEHLVLLPVRTNRTWFCESIATASLGCHLRPFPFDGHKQCFPAPLCLAYWGCRTERFANIFCRYGTIGKFQIVRRYTPHNVEEETVKTESQQSLNFGG